MLLEDIHFKIHEHSPYQVQDQAIFIQLVLEEKYYIYDTSQHPSVPVTMTD